MKCSNELPRLILNGFLRTVKVFAENLRVLNDLQRGYRKRRKIMENASYCDQQPFLIFERISKNITNSRRSRKQFSGHFHIFSVSQNAKWL